MKRSVGREVLASFISERRKKRLSTLYLFVDQWESLQQLSSATGLSVSDLIRRILDTVLQSVREEVSIEAKPPDVRD